MADWFKLQNDIAEDGHIQTLAGRLTLKLPFNLRVTIAAGACARLWAHFDKQTLDGFVAGMTRDVVDFITGVDGFAALLETVGWLLVTDDGVRIPDFEKHNGETAKQRAQAAQRSARHRNGKEPRPKRDAHHATTVTNPVRPANESGTNPVRIANQESESEECVPPRAHPPGEGEGEGEAEDVGMDYPEGLPPDFELTDVRRERALIRGVAKIDLEACFDGWKNRRLADGAEAVNWDRDWDGWCSSWVVNHRDRPGGDKARGSSPGPDIRKGGPLVFTCDHCGQVHRVPYGTPKVCTKARGAA